MRYYRGDPGELLSIREEKMERAKMLRKERNMMKRGEAVWGRYLIISSFGPEFSETAHFYYNKTKVIIQEAFEYY